jgi:hypothetical protein
MYTHMQIHRDLPSGRNKLIFKIFFIPSLTKAPARVTRLAAYWVIAYLGTEITACWHRQPYTAFTGIIVDKPSYLAS